jgi:hypothetical protein
MIRIANTAAAFELVAALGSVDYEAEATSKG